MNSSLMVKVVSFLASLLLACSAFAAPPIRTADAHDLLRQLHDDAYQVRDAADQLEAYNREPFLIDWRIEADTLQSAKDEINHMDRTLDHLRAMQKALPQDEQAEINEVTPALVELTDTAQAAISFLNHNQNDLWMPQYTAYADEMYSEAGRVERYSLTPVSNPTVGAKVNPCAGMPNCGNGNGS
jgi:hypothetical protein